MSPDLSRFKYDYVLLIDDIELDNFINKKLIQTYGFSKNIYVSSSAAGALEFLDNLAIIALEYPQLSPGVIFVDINMPGMDGFEFIDAFRKSISRQVVKPKLVILTSSAAATDREKTLGISDEIIFLNKPLLKGMLDEL